MYNAYVIWSTGAQLELRLAAMAEAGEPASIAELEHKPIPPDQNAYTYIQQAFPDIIALEQGLMPWYEMERYRTARLEPDEQKKLQTLLESYPRIVPLLEQAAACPDYTAPINLQVLPQEFISSGIDVVQKNREVARVLVAYSTLRVSQGRRDEAVRLMVLLLRLTRHWDGDPALVSYLVSLACRGMALSQANLALQSGPVSKESRDGLDRELALHEPMDGYPSMFKSERALGLSMMQTMPWAGNWLMRGMQNTGTLYYLQTIDEYLDAASRPYWEVLRDKRDVPRSNFGPRVVVDLLRPALDAGRQAGERTRALVRSLRVLNVIQTRTAPKPGEVPALATLGLPASTTTDPFNGQPLIVKHLATGWLVYSVGPNLEDDGGTIADYSDVGFGPIAVKAAAK